MKHQIQMIIDLDRCWGCKACEMACKQELGLSVGPRPMLVEEIGPRRIDGKLYKDFVPVMCQHCNEPACMAVCPEEAIFKAADGTIQIDPDECIRCGACEDACPYGAVEQTEFHGPVKCTLCFSRRKDNWLPSCAQHCPGRAFAVGSEEEMAGVRAEKKYSWTAGRVIYISDLWTDLGKNP